MGYFIPLTDNIAEELADPTNPFPEDLRAVLSYARDAQARWLMLDCDADEVDGLLTYVW